MMRYLIVYLIGAALVSLSFITTPAYADCAADLSKAEDRFTEGKFGKRGKVHVSIKIEKAKEKLAKGNEKGCKKMVKKAHKTMDKQGYN